MLRDQHVLDDGEHLHKADVLEGPADAHRDTMMRGEADRLCPTVRLRPRRGFVDTHHAVEERRLTGAVRADQTDDLPLTNAEVHIVECLQAAEADTEVRHVKDGHPHLPVARHDYGAASAACLLRTIAGSARSAGRCLLGTA